MEYKGSLLYSQEPATDTSPELYEYTVIIRVI
jgi:hypothetical protein